MIKHILLIFSVLTLMSCSVEQRIKDHSYTREWHYVNATRYQVYRTKFGRRYIIVLNKHQTKTKRKYIKR